MAGSLALASTNTVTAQDDNAKPNIILIIADDMGYECLGTYGSAEYNTPHLDKMAEEGVKFMHCYAQPLCTPSRVKIMTGMYNYRNYEKFDYLNPTERTFGNYLKSAGYSTCIAGKWQLNGIYGEKKPAWDDMYRPYQFGFDEYCLWQFHKAGREGGKFSWPLIVENGKERRATIDEYGPDIYCNFILDFIDRKKGDPFFVYYPMGLVHAPFTPTPDSEEWDNFQLRRDDQPKHFPDMVEYADKIVGRIMDKLKKEGLLENTLVIFTGDNGTHKKIHTKMKDGKEIQGGKGLMTDAGTRVPLIAYWKGKVIPGSVVTDLVDFSDFVPTLCDAANVNIPDHHTIDGISFLPQVLGKTGTQKAYVYMYFDPKWQNFDPNCFLRNKTYKLYGDGRFYNVKKNPLEQANLLDKKMTKTEKEVYQKLSEELEKRPCPLK